jgi:hypothetical protein
LELYVFLFNLFSFFLINCQNRKGSDHEWKQGSRRVGESLAWV